MKTSARVRMDAYLKGEEALNRAWVDTQVARGRFDSGTGIAVLKALTHTSKELVMQRFPELRFRMHLPPVPDTPPPGTSKYEWYFGAMSGKARVSNGQSGNPPRIDVNVDGAPNTSNVRHIDDFYGFTDVEVEQMALTGMSPSMKPMGAREALERKKNELAYLGSSTWGVSGFLSDANVPDDVAAKAFSAMTAQEMYDFLMDETDQVWIDSDTVYTADTVLLPPAQYKILKKAMFADPSKTSVLSKFLENSQFIKAVDYCRELKGAGSGATDLMMVYPRDPRVVGYIEPLPLASKPPQEHGNETQFYLRAEFGGVANRHPQSCLKRHGI